VGFSKTYNEKETKGIENTNRITIFYGLSSFAPDIHDKSVIQTILKAVKKENLASQLTTESNLQLGKNELRVIFSDKDRKLESIICDENGIVVIRKYQDNGEKEVTVQLGTNDLYSTILKEYEYVRNN
jgi:hypothetical protein